MERWWPVVVDEDLLALRKARCVWAVFALLLVGMSCEAMADDRKRMDAEQRDARTEGSVDAGRHGADGAAERHYAAAMEYQRAGQRMKAFQEFTIAAGMGDARAKEAREKIAAEMRAVGKRPAVDAEPAGGSVADGLAAQPTNAGALGARREIPAPIPHANVSGRCEEIRTRVEGELRDLPGDDAVTIREQVMAEAGCN